LNKIEKNVVGQKPRGAVISMLYPLQLTLIPIVYPALIIGAQQLKLFIS